MKTDRELLELAAKAAGIEIKGWTAISGQEEAVIGFDAYTVETWNPLTDDGDALRLAVCLNMEVFRSKVNEPRPWVSAVIRNTTVHGAEDIGNDPYAATRLAITRAAAAIGEALP